MSGLNSRDVAVFSHRRSGTHLAIDTIRNNFAGFADAPVNLDALRIRRRAPGVRSRLYGRDGGASLVLKSHSPGDLRKHFVAERAHSEAQAAVRDAKKVYVYRDGRDVMASLYFYILSVIEEASPSDFPAFLRSKDLLSKRPSYPDLDVAEYWNHHILTWWGRPDVLYISFESMLDDYGGVVRRIADFLDVRMPRTIRRVVRRAHKNRSSWTPWFHLREQLIKLYQHKVRGLRYSSVHFRSGHTGTYRNLFSAEDLQYFADRASRAMKTAGYEISQLR